MTDASEQKQVLITGGAGRIGKALAEHLEGRYRLRLLYHRTIPEAHAGARGRPRERGPGPLEDAPRGGPGQRERPGGDAGACAGVDAVAHMAADPRVQAPWEAILEANIAGTYAVYEGPPGGDAEGDLRLQQPRHRLLREGRRLHHAGDAGAPGQLLRGLQVLREALGRYYVDAFGMSVICLRIGSFQPRPRGERQLATWISHRDTAQLVWRGIEADLPFGVFYGISGNTRAYWDIANARELLGYAPAGRRRDLRPEVLAG